MLRFCANLGFLYPHLPLVDAMAEAAAAGFSGVEYAAPYEVAPEVLRAGLDRFGLTQVLINAPKPLDVALVRRYAAALGCTRVNLLSGPPPAGMDAAQGMAAYVESVGATADALAADGVIVLVEHINSLDLPGFLVDTPRKAFDVVDVLDRDNVRVQFDVYHAQRMAGNLIETLRAHIAEIGHVQISDVPGRTAPGLGEIAYENVLRELDALGYEGWVGLEYRPAPGQPPSFDWMDRWGFLP